MKVAMLSPNLPPRQCGVGDFVARLAGELAPGGEEVVLMASAGGDVTCDGISVVRVPGGPWHLARAVQAASSVLGTGAGLFHYHYVPFLYGPRGVSLGASLLPVLVRRRGVPVVTTLHEIAMPWGARPGQFAMAAAQRLQLVLLVAGSDAVVVTTGHRANVMRKWFPWRAQSIHRIPVGATVEPGRSRERDDVRRELGLDGVLAVGFFGTAHPSKNLGLVVRCVQDMVDGGTEARLLCVGLGEGELRAAAGPGSVVDTAVCTGWRPAADPRISEYASAADIYLAPMVEGVSTLRTSIMAALAHGLPVAGTVGRETDVELSDGKAVAVAPARDAAAFRKLAVELAVDAQRRAALGREAASLYQRAYSWPVLASATRRVYELASHGAHPTPEGVKENPGV